MEKKYIPQPMYTDLVDIPDSLNELTEKLAENVHEVWSKERMDDGWTHGLTRDDDKKEHPCLVSYDELPESEKQYDRNTSQETIKFILASGYSIKKKENKIQKIGEKIRRFFDCKHPDSFRLKLDRSLSKATNRQVMWVVGVLILGFGVFWLLNFIFGRPVPQGSRIIELMMDPGTFGSASHPNGFFPRLFEFVIVVFGSVFFTGVIISLISNTVEGSVDKFNKGLKSYSFSDHVLILGANRMLASIIEDLNKSSNISRKDIVVMSVSDIEKLRTRMLAELDDSKLERVTYMYGSRDSIEELQRVHATKASQIIILGEDDEPEHDSMNIACYNCLDKLCSEIQGEIECYMVIDNLTSYHVLHFNNKTSEEEQLKNSHLRLTTINSLENWAQRVLVTRSYPDVNGLLQQTCKNPKMHIEYPAIDRQGITKDSPNRVHFVVVGMTQMGIAMANTVAHIAHYPNFHEEDEHPIRTKITFIGENLRKEMDFYKGHYSSLFQLAHSRYVSWDASGEMKVEESLPDSHYGDFLDVEWEFIDGGIQTTEVRALIDQWTSLEGEYANEFLTIAVCGKDPHGNTATALYLPDSVFKAQIPVFVYHPVMGEMLEKAHQTLRYSNLYPFGMRQDCFDSSLKLRTEWAKRVNYLYKQGRPAEGSIFQKEMDDMWYKLSFTMKLSNLWSASSLPTKLRSLGLTKTMEVMQKGKSIDIPMPGSFVQRDLSTNEYDMMAKVEHNRWNIERLLLGYHPIKQEDIPAFVNEVGLNVKGMNEKELVGELKTRYFTHPLIAPNSSLPKKEKDKDRILENLDFLFS